MNYPKHLKYKYTVPTFIGEIPRRVDLTILPADGSKVLRVADLSPGLRIKAKQSIPYKEVKGKIGIIEKCNGAFYVSVGFDNDRLLVFCATDIIYWFEACLEPSAIIEHSCRVCERKCTQDDKCCWWCGTKISV